MTLTLKKNASSFIKTHSGPRILVLASVLLACSLGMAFANLQVNLSVKFILNADGTRPIGGIGNTFGFGAEIAHGNQVLTATGRGFQLVVVEYVDIQPPAPDGQPSDHWFNLDARSNREAIESAARANPATWRWNASTINLYVNNSGSGQCSFVGSGLSISLGNDIAPGTVLHELGHFFNLRHTHSAADNDGTVDDWGDGDSLAETLDDDPDASPADINARYPNETQQKRDDLIFNVMSYHLENRLLPAQMDIWTQNAIGPRLEFCSPRTWFVANNGFDFASGASEGSPFATLARALVSAGTSVGPIDDDIVLRGGTYGAPPGSVIGTPCTLRALHGSVRITRP